MLRWKIKVQYYVFYNTTKIKGLAKRKIEDLQSLVNKSK